MRLPSLACVFTFLLFTLPPLVNTEIKGSCSFQGLDLEKCINDIEISKNLDSYCVVINQAVKTGIYCICSLLASAPLSMQELNCSISIPPLAQCQALVPTLLHRQASDSEFQVPLSSEVSILLPSPSPPQPDDVRLNSTFVINFNYSATNSRVFTSKCEFSSGYKTMNSMFLLLFPVLAI